MVFLAGKVPPLCWDIVKLAGLRRITQTRAESIAKTRHAERRERWGKMRNAGQEGCRWQGRHRLQTTARSYFTPEIW